MQVSKDRGGASKLRPVPKPQPLHSRKCPDPTASKQTGLQPSSSPGGPGDRYVAGGIEVKEVRTVGRAGEAGLESLH